MAKRRKRSGSRSRRVISLEEYKSQFERLKDEFDLIGYSETPWSDRRAKNLSGTSIPVSQPSASMQLESNELGPSASTDPHNTTTITEHTLGDYAVVQAPSDQAEKSDLSDLLQKLSSVQQLNMLAELLQRLSSQPDILPVLLEQVERNPQLFGEAAAILNLASYQHAVAQLEHLIVHAEHVTEHQFQALLKEHPWIFGSEYSALIDRRRWTRDEQQDFVLRRTSDGYIELVEIKTPFEGADLFRYDRSHDSYYAGIDLSKVVGQVQKYIERLDDDRLSILARDQEDTLKIRAKIIIGRDGDEHQQRALRIFNGHLYRIEVITFDQLLRIARNVLCYLEDKLQPPAETAEVAMLEDEDIPF